MRKTVRKAVRNPSQKELRMSLPLSDGHCVLRTPFVAVNTNNADWRFELVGATKKEAQESLREQVHKDSLWVWRIERNKVE